MGSHHSGPTFYPLPYSIFPAHNCTPNPTIPMADLSDFKVKRDDDGDVQPVEDTTPKYGFEIKIKPLTIGDTHELEGWGDDSGGGWSIEDKVYLLQNNLIDADGWDGLPEVEEEAIEYLEENWSPYAIEDIVTGIFFASGLEPLFNEGKIREMLEGTPDEPSQSD